MKLLFVLAAVAAANIASAAVFRTEIGGLRLPKAKHSNRALRTSEKVSGDEQVEVQENYAVVGKITVGTPPQEFLAIFDTNFGNFGVSDLSCEECKKHGQTNLYDSSNSSSFVDLHMKFDTTYSRYPGSGKLGFETFSFGSADDQALTVPRQLTAFSERYVPGFGKASAVVGLALTPLYDYGFTSPFTTAVEGELLDENVFTLFMKKTDQPGVTSDSGVITYGAKDFENCGEFETVAPLTSSRYWRFNVDSVSLGPYSSVVQREAVIANAEKTIILPQAVYDAVVAEIGLNPHKGNQVPCKKQLPSLMFGVNGGQLTVSNYVTKDGEVCSLALTRAPDGKMAEIYQLGAPFLHAYCTAHRYDPNQVEFAKNLKN